ncbi:MAG TPA: mannonate dehydratase [Terriglobia bacterium]|nr:mannonate dehydratase [Terriglobia bacterium]
MPKFNRRECMQGVLATLAAAAAPLAAKGAPLSAAGKESGNDNDRFRICLVWGIDDQHRVKLSKQIGVTHAIAGTAGELSRVPRSRYVDTVAKIKADYEAAGLTIAGIESHPVPAEKIKLGAPGRDEEIENYIAAIHAIGKAGIPMVCYDFMAGIDWYRTGMHVPGRGGCSSVDFNIHDVPPGLTKWGRISKEKMWDNITYFLKAVMPEAEKANVKMALHPDDPPIPELRGIARIIISPDAYRRVMGIVPSPVNGVTFEIAIYHLMGADLEAVAREFGGKKKIFFIHSRNLRGTRDNFVETFQDNGVIDFGKVYQALHESGVHVPLRPDHDPILDGETNVHPGYGVLGKIFGVAYIKGILASRNIPYI